jgi:23S rRNA (uracil1939-C5)-methyltransferase
MAGLTKNSIISVEINDLAFGGMGVGRVNNFVVFVEKALPGELVQARIQKIKSNHAQATLHAIDRPSPDRIQAPPCPLFGTCGGCTWQNFTCEQQLHWKEKQIAATLKHIGGLEAVGIRPIIASPQTWRYRNKMEYSFGRDYDGRRILGFHVPGRFDEVFNVPACLIQPEAFDVALRVLTDWANAQQCGTYDPRTHEGFLRQAVLRHSLTTGETILALLTQRGELPDREGLAAHLFEHVPGFKGMLWGLNESIADVARIDQELWRSGTPELTETVNGLTFAISPQSFFQTNTAGGELLYRTTAELAEVDAHSRVLDAYCGTGAIGLHCAQAGAGRVAGIEVVTEAIWNARENAARNHISNTTFIAAPLAQGLPLAQHAIGGDFTHVIIDPPRGGMDKRSLSGLIAQRAPMFIYVSCNPATLARDLVTLTDAGYAIDAVQPIDMFPHTYHVETSVRLRLKK